MGDDEAPMTAQLQGAKITDRSVYRSEVASNRFGDPTKESRMAKKKAKAATAPSAAAARTTALPNDIKVIPVPANATVTVDVDVNDMTIPYTIALDADVVLKSLVDRRKDLPALTPGTHRIGWGFAHTEKGWKHKVTLTVNGTPTILEERSEAKKDPDHSIGVAFLVAA
jgi:hypothetical protein